MVANIACVLQIIPRCGLLCLILQPCNCTKCCLMCCCTEPDISIESMLMKGEETVDQQHQQLTDLMQAMQAQHVLFKQLIPVSSAMNDFDSPVASIDSSALMVPASLGELSYSSYIFSYARVTTSTSFIKAISR